MDLHADNSEEVGTTSDGPAPESTPEPTPEPEPASESTPESESASEPVL